MTGLYFYHSNSSEKGGEHVNKPIKVGKQIIVDIFSHLTYTKHDKVK